MGGSGTSRPTASVRAVRDGVGEPTVRPDAAAKVAGGFVFASDLSVPGMLFGATVRSSHPRARIRGIDTARALATPGVHVVLTNSDVPAAKHYGLDLADQPALAFEEVRYQGEPIALVAADHLETARRAAASVVVDYEVLPPVVDPEVALRSTEVLVHPTGNLLRHVPIRKGTQDAVADVVARATYEVGMQDQAFLGPEAGLAVPAQDGGVELHVATQFLHVDREQVAACLGLPSSKVRLTLAGVGGAFGGREDISVQIHACLLALRTGRPVKMVYSRQESFYGHVHRHPAWLTYEHGATSQGDLVYVKARIVLDGGAYASTSRAVCANAATLGIGPYQVPNVTMDAYAVYTNNPPCGAMRGFGAVQACFAYESQMDRLAALLGMDPVELRIRNALRTGDTMPTGQRISGPAPVAELLAKVRDTACYQGPPDDATASGYRFPGGDSNTTHGEGVVRGVGYAVGIKNVGFSEGADDYATARVRLEVVNGEPAAVVYTAAAEMGQGVLTVQAQIARTELGVERVTVAPAGTAVGSAGSSSASRQTYMTGGAVRAACVAVRRRLFERLAECGMVPANTSTLGALSFAELVDLLGAHPIEETAVYRHLPTYSLDPHTGQGDAHVQFAFAAHRATVDVDLELGLVRVVEIVTAQDVGRAINPLAVEGQITGGTVQGLGLALMEEIHVTDGEIRNCSFTDYLIPTVLDVPAMRVDIVELGDPHAPYGLRGVGEPPAISSTPAIVAAIRAAAGQDLNRVPVRPEHIIGIRSHTA